ncbi:MAG: hypothetical protein NTV65_06720 [Proteobacteria bacterium]|nr:hypothetical protein [Pseudomonadota bacterium]
MATCIVAAAPCLAQNNFSGQMIASSPCSLESDDSTECMTVIVPLSGTLSIKSSLGKSLRIKVDKDGVFSKSVSSGTYDVKIERLSRNGENLPKRQFKTSPSTVTVTDDGQPQLILVYNRARSAPSTKIGIGF